MVNDAPCPQLQKELEEIEGILAEVTKMWDSQVFQIEGLSLSDSKAKTVFALGCYLSRTSQRYLSRFLNRLQHLRALV